MELLICIFCKEPLYLLQQRPRHGQSLLEAGVRSANPSIYGDPKPDTPIKCHFCGKNPLVFHNDGVQGLTQEGELIPTIYRGGVAIW